MAQFEYKTTRTSAMLEEDMNKEGAERWELVQVVADWMNEEQVRQAAGKLGATLIWKREKS